MTLFTDALKNSTKAFCLNTSQHGFKFIYLSKRTLLERIIWVLVIVMCLIAITIYSMLIYDAYANQGSTITTDTTHNPLWHYHFPAITICSVNKISLDLVEKHAGLLCKWKGDIRRCAVLFKRSLTVFGFCCSFNYLALDDEKTNHISPQRISQCNFKSALNILINVRPSNYGAYDMKTYGVNVFVHHPFEYVEWSTEFVLLPQSTTNFVSVTPQITYVSDDLVDVHPKDRNCLMSYERKLDKFRLYTRRNCMTQCRMDVVRRRCGCYPFYYNFLNDDFLHAMPRVYHHTYCDCPENCEYTTYNMQYSGGGISKNKDIALTTVGNGISIENQTSLRVFFGNIVFIKNNHTREFEFFSILALLGGLLGLFNGISILSLVEIMYWFVVRLFLQMKNARKEDTKLKKQKKDGKVSRNVYFVDFKN
ncbi:PREDICTED: sodium channel protein Nach-like [Nicrophorus vespilloides]|uniref:Sodium channel protein Nach-like n=1 Tax=Nicrophorus vespilloides TaxID=110193 RepID=A0ABM1NEV3_NICVS|nr:PREDICTED: sodium channel protein Nach-like [Nicrophorus vespilloides]